MVNKNPNVSLVFYRYKSFTKANTEYKLHSWAIWNNRSFQHKIAPNTFLLILLVVNLKHFTVSYRNGYAYIVVCVTKGLSEVKWSEILFLEDVIVREAMDFMV